MTKPALNPPQLVPPLDDDAAPLSSALADIVEALEDSMSARLDQLRVRLFDDTRNAVERSLLWIGFGVCAVGAWIALLVAFTLWIGAAQGPVVAALAVAAIHVVAALAFFAATRLRAADSVGPL